MSYYNQAVLTDLGASLLAESVTEGAKIEFVKLQTGSGIYTDEEKQTLQQRTALKELKQEFGFSSAAFAENNTLRLKAVINNDDLQEGYHITELGIIAKKEGDESEILYSIAIAEEAEYLPSKESPVEIVQDYYTKISNAESVEINVQQGAYATAEDMQAVLYPNFTEADKRENITSGENIFTLFGKIRKWFSDLKAVAFSGSYNDLNDKPSIPSVVNNNTTTTAGYALDARQANPNIAGSLGAQINAANTALVTHKTSGDHDDRYVRRDNVRYYSAGEALTTTVNSNVSTTVGKLSIAYAGRYIVRATILTTCPVIDRPWEVYAQFANADTGQVSGVSKILVPASMSTTIIINLDTYTLYELGVGTNLDVRLYQTSGQVLTIQGYIASTMRFT